MANASKGCQLHWHRMSGKVKKTELKDIESMRLRIDSAQRNIIYSNHGFATEVVELDGERRKNVYYLKHLDASEKQVQIYRDIHDLMSSSGNPTYLADGAFNGKPVMLLRNAGKPIASYGKPIKYGPVIGWMQLYEATQSLLITLSRAEAQGVVHRDIKPLHLMRNIFGGTSNEYTIIDWEGAVIVGRLKELLEANLVARACGTKGYMAPEMRALFKKGAAAVTKNVISATSSKLDVYSLGASIYELMTGYCPPKDTRGGLSWPPAFPSAWPHLQQLKQLVQDCLQHDPRDRPTFAQLIEQHAEWLEPFSQESRKGGTYQTQEAHGQQQDVQDEVLGPYYSSLKQQQPALYKQQKAWCAAARKLQPQYSPLRGALIKAAHAVDSAIACAVHNVNAAMRKMRGAGKMNGVLAERRACEQVTSQACHAAARAA